MALNTRFLLLLLPPEKGRPQNLPDDVKLGLADGPMQQCQMARLVNSAMKAKSNNTPFWHQQLTTEWCACVCMQMQEREGMHLEQPPPLTEEESGLIDVVKKTREGEKRQEEDATAEVYAECRKPQNGDEEPRREGGCKSSLPRYCYYLISCVLCDLLREYPP